MIKEKEVLIKGHPRNLKHFLGLGYSIKVGEEISVKPEHLLKGSGTILTCICTNCSKERKNAFKDYYLYTNGCSSIYYCNSCKYIKSEQTSIKKYGVSNPMKDIGVQEVLKKSMMDRYGVDHFSKTKKFKKQFQETCIDKWGVANPFMDNDIKEKIKNTNMERLGVYYPMQSEEVVNKSNTTCNEKWGKDKYSETEQHKENFYRLTKKRYIEMLPSEYEVIDYSNEKFSIKHKKCGNIFTTHKGLVYTRHRTNKIICTECNPLNPKESSIEIEVRFFLDENNIEYITNSRTLLDGQEIDIFIPKYNLALEINGLYWHSEVYRDNFYHRNKTLKCIEKGIELIHIWEDDWVNKKEIVKSILSNRIKIISERIFARNCTIDLIGSSEARTFLDKNHIQGYSSSSLKIGLKYNNKLVSLMTFGWRHTNGKKEYELIRYCNKINTQIVGGASKLFNFFSMNNSYDQIISYADISIFNGGLYKKLGFEKTNLSKPNYYWVVKNTRRHRFNYTKKKLVSSGYDVNKTEVEIMHELGYYRIFSTGQEKWIFQKKI